MNVTPLKDCGIKIIFSDLAYDKMAAYVELSSLEIGWLGLTEKVDNVITVKDVFLVKQSVGPAETVLDEEATAHLVLRLITEGVYDPESDNTGLFFWGHSHVNMSPGPSGQDVMQFNKLINDQEYFIRFIMNKSRDYSLSLYVKDSLFGGVIIDGLKFQKEIGRASCRERV